MCGNFREYAKMTTRSRHCPETNLPSLKGRGTRAEDISHLPLLFYLLFEIPVSSAFFTSWLKDRMSLFPLGIQCSLPHCLRFRTNKNIFAEAFKLQSITTIKQRVIRPV